MHKSLLYVQDNDPLYVGDVVMCSYCPFRNSQIKRLLLVFNL